jgi:hypothetical protein
VSICAWIADIAIDGEKTKTLLPNAGIVAEAPSIAASDGYVMTDPEVPEPADPLAPEPAPLPVPLEDPLVPLPEAAPAVEAPA